MQKVQSGVLAAAVVIILAIPPLLPSLTHSLCLSSRMLRARRSNGAARPPARRRRITKFERFWRGHHLCKVGYHHIRTVAGAAAFKAFSAVLNLARFALSLGHVGCYRFCLRCQNVFPIYPTAGQPAVRLVNVAFMPSFPVRPAHKNVPTFFFSLSAARSGVRESLLLLLLLLSNHRPKTCPLSLCLLAEVRLLVRERRIPERGVHYAG